jgi:CHAT domain-containing protein
VVVHDSASARWPWEALCINGWAPAAESGLSRRYAAEGMSVAKWREQRRRERDLNVLLVVNPTGDLPGAVQEGERVAQMLARLPGTGITVIRGGEATRARLLAEFRSGDYDAIHFAGHAFFDTAAPASSGILCAGGRVLSGADLAAMDSVPALVFFNACESGRLRSAVNPLRQLDRSVGFAEAFLRGGVANFIGTWWPVSDAGATAFATPLYRGLAKGASIGTALNAARSAVRALPSADWANYLHYGSFDFALKASR